MIFIISIVVIYIVVVRYRDFIDKRIQYMYENGCVVR